ncbi:hypothetical protein GCM10011371_07710 [Novosphingobium marinum]|uniref:RNA-binding protein AU-1/Ribonuclease E/G domain-containing protein n=1 Tax=Novosphingobium marinum TaxID=1514948 RepID=A0A7Z0BST3_9SPHN|nr:ribonuclease E/G [Novosphingobium marinum]NYH94459.1 hypothetical protein [Novosphingobium marinum]GGC22481.1 hypothetical protein GCM10011371_07710 [Novosphingobium marinum]
MAERAATGWQVERGIGEDRAVLFRHGEPVAAKIDWHGGLSPGAVIDAVLVSRAAGSRRGTAMASGEELLVEGLPREASEGAPIRLEIVRAAMSEAGRGKHARARPSGEALRPAPALAELLAHDDEPVATVRRFSPDCWSDIAADASAGEIAFDGGTLVLGPTPGMTVIDIDGTLPPAKLALAAVPAVARAIRLLDLGGSIGIDFPTLASRAERKTVDEALAGALGDWPHERTAMNGFGFVQVVARQARPSLLHRARYDASAWAARFLLRQAEALTDPGAILLAAHPATLCAISPSWIEELARRTGREVRTEARPDLAIRCGLAQVVPR